MTHAALTDFYRMTNTQKMHGYLAMHLRLSKVLTQLAKERGKTRCVSRILLTSS